MKYRLKRDLPFAEAGDRVFALMGELSDKSYYVYVESRVSSIQKTVKLGLLGDLLREDWLEEVKPREWKVAVSSSGDIYSFYDKNIVECREIRIEIIKVRELLE